MIFLAIGAFSLHASSEGEASSALSSSPQSGPRASTASRVCPAPKQLTEPWPRPSLWSVRCLLASVWLTATHFCFFLVLVPLPLGMVSAIQPALSQPKTLVSTPYYYYSRTASILCRLLRSFPQLLTPTFPQVYFFFVNPSL